MIKKCLNCKIEFTPTLMKVRFCDIICEIGYKKKWLYKLKRNDEFMLDLFEKHLLTYY